VIEQPIPLPPPPPIPQQLYAGFWIRVLSRIIDGFVLAPLYIPIIVQILGPVRRAMEEANRTGQPFQAPDIAPIA